MIEESQAITTQPPRPLDPLQLLQALIQQGPASAEALRTMTDLQDRWRAANAAEAFSVAMATAQREMPVTIATNATNKHTQKKYADLDGVNKVIVPIAAKHGLSLSFGTEKSELAGFIKIVADVRHIQGHVERYSYELPLDGQGSQGKANAMNVVQAHGSTLSYGRRYLTLAIFNRSTGEDNDAQGFADFLNETQVAEVETLLRDCDDAGDPVQIVKFLEWAQADTIDRIPVRRLELVLAELRRRLKVAKTKGEKK